MKIPKYACKTKTNDSFGKPRPYKIIHQKCHLDKCTVSPLLNLVNQYIAQFFLRCFHLDYFQIKILLYIHGRVFLSVKTWTAWSMCRLNGRVCGCVHFKNWFNKRVHYHVASCFSWSKRSLFIVIIGIHEEDVARAQLMLALATSNELLSSHLKTSIESMSFITSDELLLIKSLIAARVEEDHIPSPFGNPATAWAIVVVKLFPVCTGPIKTIMPIWGDVILASFKCMFVTTWPVTKHKYNTLKYWWIFEIWFFLEIYDDPKRSKSPKNRRKW